MPLQGWCRLAPSARQSAWPLTATAWLNAQCLCAAQVPSQPFRTCGICLLLVCVLLLYLIAIHRLETGDCARNAALHQRCPDQDARSDAWLGSHADLRAIALQCNVDGPVTGEDLEVNSENMLSARIAGWKGTLKCPQAAVSTGKPLAVQSSTTWRYPRKSGEIKKRRKI